MEESRLSSIGLMDKKVEEVTSGNSFGIGVRLLFGDEAVYGYTSDLGEDGLLKLTENLAASHKETRKEKHGGAPNPFRAETLDDRHTVRVAPESVPRGDRVDRPRTPAAPPLKPQGDSLQVRAPTHATNPAADAKQTIAIIFLNMPVLPWSPMTI